MLASRIVGLPTRTGQSGRDRAAGRRSTGLLRIEQLVRTEQSGYWSAGRYWRDAVNDQLVAGLDLLVFVARDNRPADQLVVDEPAG